MACVSLLSYNTRDMLTTRSSLLSTATLIVLLLHAATHVSAQAAPVPAGAFHTIILVRHGAYDADRNDPEKSSLNPLGIAQARLVAARLAALPGNTDAFVSSPVVRAHQTARVIAADMQGRPIEILTALSECSPPSRRPEAAAKTPEAVQESAACASRLGSVFASLFVPASSGKPRRTMIIAHGNVIRYLITRALGVDTKAWLEMSVANASITQVLVEPDGRFKVISVGDVGHLPPSMHNGTTGTSERPLVVP